MVKKKEKGAMKDKIKRKVPRATRKDRNNTNETIWWTTYPLK